MKDVISVDSNSKSEDTPRMIDVHRKQLRAQRWLQDNTHEGITSEPPQDSPLGQVTSLDDILPRDNCPSSCDGYGTYAEADQDGDPIPAQCQWCYEVVVPLREKLLAWHKTEQAKLLQVIEDEVILVQCKECEGAHFFKAVPLEALKQIKDNVINGGSVYE